MYVFVKFYCHSIFFYNKFMVLFLKCIYKLCNRSNAPNKLNPETGGERISRFLLNSLLEEISTIFLLRKNNLYIYFLLETVWELLFDNATF